MEGFELLKQGAEAKIYVGTYLNRPAIVKERFVKQYRHPALDTLLMKERIKAESRAIVRCKGIGIHTPTLYLIDLKRQIIIMEYFKHSISVKDFIFTADFESLDKLSEEIGLVLAKMHANNIIHGDLTTSNMLLMNKNDKSEYDNFDDLKLVFIDFGLARIESSVEEKGVDLYVLERAILSLHSNAEKIFPSIMKSYQKGSTKKEFKEVFTKFEEVRARGRKRTMVG